MPSSYHQETARDTYLLTSTDLMEMSGHNGVPAESQEEKWVHDSSVDYKGRVPLRKSTGTWRASLFILTIEVSERLCYYGIATNLVTYLTKVLHEELKTAANNVNYWLGTTTLMPLIGGFIADSYTGRFSLALLSSVIYLMGLILLTLSRMIPSLKPCNSSPCPQPRKIHEVIFFLSLYCISVGTGGHKPCLQSFGADQFDDNHSKEKKQKLSFFNWWNFAVGFGLLLGLTVIVYLQDYVSWGIAYLVLAITMGITLLTFYLGRPFYRYRIPEGSPFIPILQVIVAAMKKRNLTCPTDPAKLYELAPQSNNSQSILLCHTDRLRFLDKAAIIGEGTVVEKESPWRLATVTRVEETKLVVNVIPIWLSILIFGVGLAQQSTFFVKQAAAMNVKVNDNFSFPPASINAVGALGMIFCVILYDKVLVPNLRRITGNERGISILKRIGIGMAFPTLSFAIAALIEKKRLSSFERAEKITVFWLVPQTAILGIGDGFALVGLQEFFYGQVPNSMRSLGIALYLSIVGLGSFLSSLLIIIVDHATDKNGRSWIGKDVNSSRLDYFYWLIAVLNALNLLVFVVLARRYIYKTVKTSTALTDVSFHSEHV